MMRASAARRTARVDRRSDRRHAAHPARRSSSRAPGVEIWAKAEFCNPGGSVKDRAALQMIHDGVAVGRLTRDKILIDSTSGNTGVAYSLFGAALGYQRRAGDAGERVGGAQAHHARLRHRDHLLVAMEGSDGAIRLVRELVAEDPGQVFLPRSVLERVQPARALPRHRARDPRSRPAIASRTSSPASARAARSWAPGGGSRSTTRAFRCVAVEPDDALHGLEGLKHLAVVARAGDLAARRRSSIGVCRCRPTRRGTLPTGSRDEEGLFVGHSAGAAVAGALRVAREVPASRARAS